MVAREGWTPDYVAAMPFDQLLAWAGSGEITQDEALAKIRRRRRGGEE